MSISNNVSFLSQSTSQVTRLNDLRVTFDILQRQVTTQKKFDTFSGYGVDSLPVQRLKHDQLMIQDYIDNINIVTTRMELMNETMQKISEVATQMVSVLSVQGQDGENEIESITQTARQNLQFIEDMLNTEVDGRYIFAGSDSSNMPFINDSILNSNFSTEVTSWLGGGQTPAQLISNMNAYSTANLGLSSGLAAAGTVTTRISSNTDMDYTVKADMAGFKDIIRALGLAANLAYPDPAVDVATPAEFATIIDNIKTIAGQGIQGIKDTTKTLAGKFNILNAYRELHAEDLNLMTTHLDDLENVDPSSTIAMMQAVQTQLTASYQVTRMVSEMTIVNFM